MKGAALNHQTGVREIFANKARTTTGKKSSARRSDCAPLAFTVERITYDRDWIFDYRRGRVFRGSPAAKASEDPAGDFGGG
jgi:hypothetical protein